MGYGARGRDAFAVPPLALAEGGSLGCETAPSAHLLPTLATLGVSRTRRFARGQVGVESCARYDVKWV